MDLHEIWYLVFFEKSVEKINKSDKNNRYFAWQPVYIYENILLSS